MTRTTSELSPPSPNFRTIPTGGRSERMETTKDYYLDNVVCKGLYFDGRKDSTLIEEKVDTKRYTRKAKEEHLCLIEELGSHNITHLSPSFGTAKQISATIIGYFEGITRDLSQFLEIGCDGTSVNTGWKYGVIRCLELKLGKPLQWVICLLHFNEHLL
ncbi:hypothetical protein AVEN_180855-1 [Araneus ventricosus]|uniref:DUF4371 domain-containing protein n=1 Tax=Araneus ventricosus TaxID=182803 RepID=A0A4Y2HAP2_ARAVE|nr:hypothetical protein AVEN_180855-1 [Araneus ventricosus]